MAQRAPPPAVAVAVAVAVTRPAAASNRSNSTAIEALPAPAASPCAVGVWGAWSTCSITCGVLGTKRRNRTMAGGDATAASCARGGPSAERRPLLAETAPCHPGPCARFCRVSAWSAWGPCCGTGSSRQRTREVLTRIRRPGFRCPALLDRQRCGAVQAGATATVAVCGAGGEAAPSASCQCRPCKAGRFKAAAGPQPCDMCPSNAFSAGPGRSHCRACPLGRTSEPSDGAKCEAHLAICPAGKFSNEGGACMFCGKGRFSRGGFGVACAFCPAGKFSPSPISAQCYACAPGRVAPEAGAASCACAPGTVPSPAGNLCLKGFATLGVRGSKAAQQARRAIVKTIARGAVAPKPPWLRGGGGGLVNTAASLRDCEAQCKDTASCRFGCFTESHECWLAAYHHVIDMPPCESTCISFQVMW